jgi:hypothetical protein
MSKRYTADGKRKSSMVHATRVWTCNCGRRVAGNGGRSSHQRACDVWAEHEVRRLERFLAIIEGRTFVSETQAKAIAKRDRLRERLHYEPWPAPLPAHREERRIMRPSKGADRPSVLAVNPNNREASAARRARLIAAFDSLDEDTRADLLEAIETIAFRATSAVDAESTEARGILRRIYAAAGFELWRTSAPHPDTEDQHRERSA